MQRKLLCPDIKSILPQPGWFNLVFPCEVKRIAFLLTFLINEIPLLLSILNLFELKAVWLNVTWLKLVNSMLNFMTLLYKLAKCEFGNAINTSIVWHFFYIFIISLYKSRNKSSWPVFPMRVKFGLRAAHAPFDCFESLSKFPYDVFVHCKAHTKFQIQFHTNFVAHWHKRYTKHHITHTMVCHIHGMCPYYYRWLAFPATSSACNSNFHSTPDHVPA